MNNVQAIVRVLETFGEGRPLHYKEIYKLAEENGWTDAIGETPWHTMARDARVHIYGNEAAFLNMPKKYTGMFGLSTETDEVIVPEVVYTNPETGYKNYKARRYARSAYVANLVKNRANGICDLCREPAPFEDLNGIPFLEEHHIIWLSDAGSDSTINARALCPNCHRKMHFVRDEDDIIKLTEMYQ